MGEVVLRGMGLLNTVWMIDTVLCLNFDIHVISFDVDLVDNQRVTGENSVVLRTSEDEKKKKKSHEKKKKKSLRRNKQSKVEKTETETLVNSDECTYRYPEKEQVEYILNNMTQELSMVFVKTNEWLKDKISKKSRQLPNAGEIRRALDTKFHLTHQKRQAFFRGINSNILKEYGKFYNKTTELVERPGHNTCKHQDEVNALWHNLLERSVATVRDGVHQCITDYLGEHEVVPESALGVRVHNYLLDKIRDIKFDVLIPLCDDYHICYDKHSKEFRLTKI